MIKKNLQDTVKQASHKKEKAVWFDFYDITKVVKPTKAENKVVFISHREMMKWRTIPWLFFC